MTKNSSYKALYHALHGEEVCKDDLIVKTRKITEELVDSAQRFIKLYREYRNDVLSEEELINSVEFLNKKSRIYSFCRVIFHILQRNFMIGQMLIL